jgi:branched-chain amino acid transport system substrate-binding protein
MGITRRGRKATLSIAVAAATMAAIAGCSSSDAGSTASSSGSGGGEYVVGFTGGLTGSLAQLSGAYLDGYKAYFDALNASGGINGHKVKLIALDDMANATTGVANVKQLAQSDQASVIANVLSNVLAGAAPIAASLQVPIISEGTTSNLVYPAQQYIFAGDDVVGDEPTAMVAFTAPKLESIAHPKIAIVRQESAALQDWYSALSNEIKQKGWSVVSNQVVPIAAVNANAEATAMAAEKPDLIYSALTAGGLTSLVQTLRQQGYNGIVMNFGSGGADPAAYEQIKDPNVYTLSPFNYASITNPPAGVKNFIAAAKAEGTNPNAFWELHGYTMAIVISKAFTTCGFPCSGAQMADALNHTVVNTMGLTFAPISYTSNNHVGAWSAEFFHWDPAKAAFVSVSQPIPVTHVG